MSCEIPMKDLHLKFRFIPVLKANGEPCKNDRIVQILYLGKWRNMMRVTNMGELTHRQIVELADRFTFNSGYRITSDQLSQLLEEKGDSNDNPQ